MSLGVTLLLAFIGLIAIMVGSCVYYSWLMNKMIYARLSDLDIIRQTQLPPMNWQRAIHKKLERKQPITDGDMAAQHKKNMRGIDQLISFATKTHLMEDEDTRKLILSELKRTRQSWLNGGDTSGQNH